MQEPNNTLASNKENTILAELFSANNSIKVAKISLNNTASLNALTLDMVTTLHSYLVQWQEDDEIACIFITSKGGKAFCAGGDVTSMYHAKQHSPKTATEVAQTFFAKEYALDYAIHTYPKPIIMWGSGFIMGGGLGLYSGGSSRVITETARVAMPEITIGLYPDVGASYFLNKLPGKIGLFLGLTGAHLNARDCLDIGLADVFIEEAKGETFFHTLCQQSWQSEQEAQQKNNQIIQNLLSDFSKQSSGSMPKGNLTTHIDTINSLFDNSDTHTVIDNFLSHTTDDTWLEKAQHNLSHGSPLSALIIAKQLDRAKTMNLTEAFQSELILSTNIAHFSEFTEGVRARLIDKDNKPQWHYSHHQDIPDEFIDQFFSESYSGLFE